jgi:hypothetical protein
MSQQFEGDMTLINYAFTDTGGVKNVLNTIEMIAKGEIKIAGAYYNMKTGEITFIN